MRGFGGQILRGEKMISDKNSGRCELVAEYGFFKTQESRTRFLEKRDFKEIKTLFNIWAFLFGPLAYIFSGMFLKGLWRMLIILFAIWIEGMFETYVINFQFFNNWIIFPTAVFISYAIFALWTIDYFKKHRWHLFLFFAVFLFVVHVGYALQLGTLVLYLTSIKFSGVFFVSEFNIILAFLYTIDRCKQISPTLKDD